jgi:2-polyprenyl-3-methyl-5-hydroxy-6-metoxy-1,4-benzoquinol methylase
LVCEQCGAAQSPCDDQWLGEIREIYNDYQIYHQSGGVEQYVVDPVTNLLRQRSEVLLDRLSSTPGVPLSGKILDVGCGTGGTLKAFSTHGDWRLYGLDFDGRNLPFLASIRGFDTLYTCTPDELRDDFDIITMVHSLEHFPEPLSTLKALRNKIRPGGCLFAEVPNADANPFDYLVADHMLHFTPASLAGLALRANLQQDHLATTWVTKELSLVARPRGATGPRNDSTSQGAKARISAHVSWLLRLVDTARKIATDATRFGLFGASIAATWLCGVLGDAVSFFVEEDANRIGRTHMGRPIISPAQVPSGSVVFLALIPQIALRVEERLHGAIDLRLPPMEFDHRIIV